MERLVVHAALERVERRQSPGGQSRTHRSYRNGLRDRAWVTRRGWETVAIAIIRRRRMVPRDVVCSVDDLRLLRRGRANRPTNSLR